MIIQNSKKLLEDLSRLETQIQKWEEALRELNPQYDQEEVLKAVLKNYLNK